jgi:hypothetical protein
MSILRGDEMSDFVVGPMGEQMDATEYAEACASALAFQAEQSAYIAAQEQAEADRQTALAQPLAPLPVEGSTVAEVKASAGVSIADLASQMQAKIDAILGGV